MRCATVVWAVLLLCGPAWPQKAQPAPPPTQFEIGRRTFFDFGPPFNYYEILIVRPAARGSSVERITLTPAGYQCFAPAKMEVASASLSESVASLLGTNPCSIPDKDLRRELKRCKKCLAFSGTDVTMQVQCGPQERLIRSAILDRDMFGAAPKTPEHTSWTMRLLARLDRALGPGVMDKPMFSLPETSEPALVQPKSANEQDLDAGTLDRLFQGAPDKPSDLYRAAHNTPVPEMVELQSSSPIAPEEFVRPEYPPLAKAARARGSVSFTVDVDEQGAPSNVIFASGSALFYGAVKTAVAQWRFPASVIGAQVRATIAFGLHCSSKPQSAH